jgi:biopolymer transport protein ExbB/TolQ
MDSAGASLWIEATHWAARGILVLLVVLSIWSVATMIKCHRIIRAARGGSGGGDLFAELQKLLRERNMSSALSCSGSSIYAGVLKELSGVTQEPTLIDRAVKSLLVLKRTQIEEGLTILATLGSNAPFIGLFGTVLGIIQAFGALGAQQSNASTVMVGISEALVATAVGLFVAIPAVIAFNFLSRQLRVLMTNCESLRDLYISKLK